MTQQYVFLQDYSQEIAKQYDDLLKQHMELLPYTLSYPISQAVDKIKTEQYGVAMNHVLDFFEISVQYSSVLLFFFLLKEKKLEVTGQKALKVFVNKIDGE